MSTVFRLVLGTHNRKKGEELAELLAPLGVRVETLAAIHHAIEVEETGSTFAENAALKATRQSLHLGKWVMGEDSGIAVDALEGRPGVYSARYSGPAATDLSNNQLLLDELAGVPPQQRSAHYECHICVSSPQGEIRAESAGVCRGRIRTEPAGDAGFGYDPLFEIVEYHRTFGQLGANIKSLISHRARALRRLVPQLRLLIGDQRNVSN